MYRVPEMGGYEAARVIREVERGMRNGDGREIHTSILPYAAKSSSLHPDGPLRAVHRFNQGLFEAVRSSPLEDDLPAPRYHILRVEK